MKNRIFAILGSVITWAIIDMLMHSKLLMADYIATASLWRPMSEMNPSATTGIAVVATTLFVFIYCQFTTDKSTQHGLKFGATLGLMAGIYYGLGSYLYMPITTTIALGWALTSILKFSAAGAISGYFLSKK